MADKEKEKMEEAKEEIVEEEAKEEENKEAKHEEKEKEATDGGRELSGIVVVLDSADGAQHTTKLDQEKNICLFNSQIWSKSMNKEMNTAASLNILLRIFRQIQKRSLNTSKIVLLNLIQTR